MFRDVENCFGNWYTPKPMKNCVAYERLCRKNEKGKTIIVSQLKSTSLTPEPPARKEITISSVSKKLTTEICLFWYEDTILSFHFSLKLFSAS